MNCGLIINWNFIFKKNRDLKFSIKFELIAVKLMCKMCRIDLIFNCFGFFLCSGLSKYAERHKLQMKLHDNWFKLIEWFVTNASWCFSKSNTKESYCLILILNTTRFEHSHQTSRQIMTVTVGFRFNLNEIKKRIDWDRAKKIWYICTLTSLE